MFSLGIGMTGYHFLESLSWLDALLNASRPPQEKYSPLFHLAEDK